MLYGNLKMTSVKSLVLRTCKRLIIILIYKLYHPKHNNSTVVLGKSEFLFVLL